MIPDEAHDQIRVSNFRADGFLPVTNYHELEQESLHLSVWESRRCVHNGPSVAPRNLQIIRWNFATGVTVFDLQPFAFVILKHREHTPVQPHIRFRGEDQAL